MSKHRQKFLVGSETYNAKRISIEVVRTLEASFPAKNYYRAGELSRGNEMHNAFVDGSRWPEAPQKQTLQVG